MQSIPSLLPQEDFLDSEYSAKDVFGEAGPAAPAAEPLQVVLQDRVQPRSREASDGGGRGRHGMSTDLGSLLIKVFNSQMIRFQALSVIPVMLKRVSTSLSAFVVLASKIWAFVVYVFKKQTRAVRLIRPYNLTSSQG